MSARRQAPPTSRGKWIILGAVGIAILVAAGAWFQFVYDDGGLYIDEAYDDGLSITFVEEKYTVWMTNCTLYDDTGKNPPLPLNCVAGRWRGNADRSYMLWPASREESRRWGNLRAASFYAMFDCEQHRMSDDETHLLLGHCTRYPGYREQATAVPAGDPNRDATLVERAVFEEQMKGLILDLEQESATMQNLSAGCVSHLGATNEYTRDRLPQTQAAIESTDQKLAAIESEIRAAGAPTVDNLNQITSSMELLIVEVRSLNADMRRECADIPGM